MKQVLIDYGIAFRIKNTIYLHKRLLFYPELHKAIIKHESEHTNNYGIKDIKLDLLGKHLKNVKKDYYKFLFTEKKAWYQLLPILRINNELLIDPTMLGVYVFTIILMLIIIHLLK